MAEGWGISADGVRAWSSGDDEGDNNLSSVSFVVKNADAAVSSVKIQSDKLRVTHDFHKTSKTSNLYEITVTFENISGSDINDIRYRRKMDFDITPNVSGDTTRTVHIYIYIYIYISVFLCWCFPVLFVFM